MAARSGVSKFVYGMRRLLEAERENSPATDERMHSKYSHATDDEGELVHDFRREVL